MATVKIGEILLHQGLITVDQLDRALTTQRRSGARLGVCLVRLGYVDEERLAAALSQQLKVPVVHASVLDDIPGAVIDRVPRQIAEAHNIVPIRVEGREVHVCLADPQNLSRLDEIAFALGCRIRPFLATEPAIERALARYYARPPDSWEDALRGTSEWRVEKTGSWRFELAEKPLPVVEAQVSSDPLPVAEAPAPAPNRPPDPYERLAAVLSRDDLVDAVSAFFGRLFPHLCLLEIGSDGARCVALRRDSEERPRPDATITIGIEGAGWLRELLARPQIIMRERPSDDHLRGMLEGLGMPPHLISVIPVFDYGRLRFVLLGLGLTDEQLKSVFGELKPYLTAVSEALRMIGLRDGIRRRARPA